MTVDVGQGVARASPRRARRSILLAFRRRARASRRRELRSQ
jgi:hypothetical protein